MRHANVVCGAAFRSIILSLAAFIVILTATGYALYHLVGATLYGELEAQINEESILFQDIYARGGEKALVEVIARLEQPVIAGPRIAALFDEQGNRLAGNLPSVPAFVGWQTLDILATNGAAGVDLYAVKLSRSTLVVGRSTKTIDVVLNRLVFDLAMAGLAVVLAALVIGYLISRGTYQKLERLAGVLDAVARGDMDVRLPVARANDQIDRVSRKINVHLEQLATLMRSTRNTVNAIAHDIRSPLNRASMRLQDVMARGGLEPESEALVDGANSELTKVGEIVDTILRIARIRGGSNYQNFEAFALKTLVLDLAEVFAPVIEGAGQTLTCDLSDSGQVQVYGDKKMLTQMLVNLIENAVCHCPATTKISLSIGETPQHGAVLRVADNGPGIDEQHRLNVLEPFYRLDASRSSPGSGLGLALVNAIAIRHDASVSLEDNSPGLCVVITFPPIGAVVPS